MQRPEGGFRELAKQAIVFVDRTSVLHCLDRHMGGRNPIHCSSEGFQEKSALIFSFYLLLGLHGLPARGLCAGPRVRSLSFEAGWELKKG
jgi:hypothetical protein